jgi:hypothetical protein
MTKPTESFAAKLSRADEHFVTLNRELEAFLKRDPYHIVRDAQRERTEYRVQVREEFPPHVSVIAGDVLQNARSALDHLAWRLAGDDPPRDTSFPIYSKRDEYFAKDRRGKPASSSGVFKIAALPDAAQTVIESMQPYHGKDLGLALGFLNEFARIDRHRALHLVGGASDDTTVQAGRRDKKGRLRMTGSAGGSMTLRLGAFDDGAVLAEFTHPPDVEVYCDFAFYVAVNDGKPDGLTYALVPCLGGLIRAIRQEVIPPLSAHLPALSRRRFAPDRPQTKIDVGDALVSGGGPDQPYRARIRRE